MEAKLNKQSETATQTKYSNQIQKGLSLFKSPEDHSRQSLPSIYKIVENRQRLEAFSFIFWSLRAEEKRSRDVLCLCSMLHSLGTSIIHSSDRGCTQSVTTVAGSMPGILDCFYFLSLHPSNWKGNIGFLVWSLFPSWGIHMKESGCLKSGF